MVLILCLSLTAVTIQPEDPSYNVTEGPNTYLDVPIVVLGVKDPDVECTVQVFTVDGTAKGEQILLQLPAYIMIV